MTEPDKPEPLQGILTGRQLAEKLLSAVNPDAVVVLSVNNFEYACIDSFYDDSGLDEGDGVCGNLVLRLDPTSQIAKYLESE